MELDGHMLDIALKLHMLVFALSFCTGDNVDDGLNISSIGSIS